MNAHRRLRAAAIGIALAITATACGGGGDGTSPGEPEPYRVGALLGLTGAYAAISEPERQALELYVAGLNADGGINGRPVELVVADTGSNESEAVNQLRRLVTQEEVVAVIGPSSSGEAVALRPISTSLRVPVMAIAASNAIITPAAESRTCSRSSRRASTRCAPSSPTPRSRAGRGWRCCRPTTATARSPPAGWRRSGRASTRCCRRCSAPLRSGRARRWCSARCSSPCWSCSPAGSSAASRRRGGGCGRALPRAEPDLARSPGSRGPPEGRQVFASMSVADNLALGRCSRRRSPGAAEDLTRVHDLFPRLHERRGQLAGTLSGGEQQMLSIGRAMMGRPSVMLLDEPSLGLSPQMVARIMAALGQLRGGGLTIVLVEQNARAALALADRAHLLQAGRVVLSGKAAELAADPAVAKVYLGGAATAAT